MNLESENLNSSESSFGGQMLPFIKLLEFLGVIVFLFYGWKCFRRIYFGSFFFLNKFSDISRRRDILYLEYLLIDVLYIEYLLKDNSSDILIMLLHFWKRIFLMNFLVLKFLISWAQQAFFLLAHCLFRKLIVS